jgi:hypothetical protein
MLPEAKHYLDCLNQARANILKTIEGLDSDALNWTPLPNDANSLIVLAVHSLGAERKWIYQLVGQHTIERDRAAEFRVRAENVSMLNAQYTSASVETGNILLALSENEMNGTREKYTVRYCILHVIEHYNEHVGQMTLTRQLWEQTNQK